VWVVPGDNAIAGTYRGTDDIAVLTDGTATIGGTEHRWSTVGPYRIRDARIASCHLLPLDPRAFDAVWRERDSPL
jgi:hypothetical protein